MIRFNSTAVALLTVAVSGLLGNIAQADLIFQSSQDVFIYQFLPTFNFATSGPAFQALLTTGDNGNGHDTRSLIAFDVSSVPWTGDQITAATLNLYVIPSETVGFGVSPDASNPVELDAAPATSAWSESGVTWNTQPSAGSVCGEAVISSVDQWVGVDVTGPVQAWLDGAVNDGLLLTQPTVVNNGNTVAVYHSSSAAANQPYLSITAAPEPSSVVALVVGCLFVAIRRTDRGRPR